MSEVEHGGEHRVTPLELFFDLVFVFAITISGARWCGSRRPRSSVPH